MEVSQYALAVVEDAVRGGVPELGLAPRVVLRHGVDDRGNLRGIGRGESELARGPLLNERVEVLVVPLGRVVGVGEEELGMHLERLQVTDVEDPDLGSVTVDGGHQLLVGLSGHVSVST